MVVPQLVKWLLKAPKIGCPITSLAIIKNNLYLKGTNKENDVGKGPIKYGQVFLN